MAKIQETMVKRIADFVFLLRRKLVHRVLLACVMFLVGVIINQERAHWDTVLIGLTPQMTYDQFLDSVVLSVIVYTLGAIALLVLGVEVATYIWAMTFEELLKPNRPPMPANPTSNPTKNEDLLPNETA